MTRIEHLFKYFASNISRSPAKDFRE